MSATDRLGLLVILLVIPSVVRGSDLRIPKPRNYTDSPKSVISFRTYRTCERKSEAVTTCKFALGFYKNGDVLENECTSTFRAGWDFNGSSPIEIRGISRGRVVVSTHSPLCGEKSDRFHRCIMYRFIDMFTCSYTLWLNLGE